MSNKILSAVIGASSGLIVSHLLLSEENPPENIEYDSITGKMKLRLVRPTPYKEVFGQFIELLINAGAFVAGREVFFTITEGMRIIIPALQYRLSSFFRNLRQNLTAVKKVPDVRNFYKKAKTDLENLKKGRTVDEEIKIDKDTGEFMKRLETLVDEFDEDILKKPTERKKFDLGQFFEGKGENVIGIPKPFEFTEFTEFEKEDKGKEEKEIIIKLEEEQKIEEVVDKIEQIIPNNPVDVEISNQPLIDDLKQDTGEEIIDESENQNYQANILMLESELLDLQRAINNTISGNIMNFTPTMNTKTNINILTNFYNVITKTEKKYDNLTELDVNEILKIIEQADIEKSETIRFLIEKGQGFKINTTTRVFVALKNKLLLIINKLQRYFLITLITFLGLSGQSNLIPVLETALFSIRTIDSILSRETLNTIRNLGIDFSLDNINSPFLKKYFLKIENLFIALLK